MKRIFIRQDDSKDCGVSCLLMIIKAYGGNTSKEYLRNLTKTSKDGTSAYDLINASEKFNFKSFGLRGNITEMKDDYYPVIAHVVKNNKYQHFVVIYKYIPNKKLLIIADPDSYGIRKMRLDEFIKMSTNEYLIFIPKGKILNCKINNKFYENIALFIYSNKLILFSIIIFSLSVVVLTIISTFYIQILMNNILPDNWYSSISFLPIIFIIINILKSFFHFIRTNILVKLIHKFDSYLNKDIYNHLFLLPNSYYLNRTTGEVVSRITDLEKIKSLMSDILFNGVISLLLSFVSFLILISINIKLSFILCFFVIFEIIVFYLFKDKMNYMLYNLKENYIRFYSYLTDTVKNMGTIKYFGYNGFFQNMFSNKHLKYLDLYNKYQKYFNLEEFLVSLGVGIFNIIIISLGYYYVLTNRLDLSLYFVFCFYILIF